MFCWTKIYKFVTEKHTFYTTSKFLIGGDSMIARFFTIPF
jgi:hypothetical protein